MDNLVCLKKFEAGKASISSAVEMCTGFEGVGSSSRVLIKPNLVGWDNRGPYPPFGVLSTSTVLEELIIALKDRGVNHISIGEASITCKDIGSSTQAIYENLGYKKWQDKYGIQLIDFNKEQLKEVDLDGHKVKITGSVDECDFLINVPVLKTHGTTVVSLGMKNLKGLLNKKSKSYFHSKEKIINQLIAALAKHTQPDLTIIDGLYALERGPLHTGTAYRKNVVLMSKDLFAIDSVGASILGYSIDEVPYLTEYAERYGRSKDLSAIKLVGDLTIDEVKQKLEWDWGWDEEKERPDFYADAGLEGFRVPHFDHTLCTGCSYLLNPMLMLILSAKTDKPFDSYEILTGKVMEPSGKAKKTFLFGKCMVDNCSDDPRIREAVPIKRCPPTFDGMVKTLKENGVDCKPEVFHGYRQYIMRRYGKDPAFDLKDYYLGTLPA